MPKPCIDVANDAVVPNNDACGNNNTMKVDRPWAFGRETRPFERHLRDAHTCSQVGR